MDTRTIGCPTLADSPTLMGTISESMDFYESLAAWTLAPAATQGQQAEDSPEADQASGGQLLGSSGQGQDDKLAATTRTEQTVPGSMAMATPGSSVFKRPDLSETTDSAVQQVRSANDSLHGTLTLLRFNI
jgi:hypothetical protein